MKNRIPALYKSNFENIGLYFFVEAQKQIVPAISIEQAIRNYCKFICSDEDMNNTDSLRVIYHRMKKKQFDAAKTVNKLD